MIAPERRVSTPQYWRSPLRVGLMSREYPPDVYGGAGVHVEYLSRELAKKIEVEVHCWGNQ